jgi:hypothetical protein
MKPLVFFSHSSRDADDLGRLKKLLVARTNGTIDFFLSGDQDSITAGRNWVSDVFTALSRADVIFTFLSPDSLQSQWVFFEAGIGYYRDIQVVPVGMLGVNAGEIPPPLGLLEGFNLDSPQGLGRIIQVINAAFSHAHSTEFTERDFDTFQGISHETTAAIPDGTHHFRVFSIGEDGERAHERLELEIHHPMMTVRSKTWESFGIMERNRYLGRFKFMRGNSPNDLGIHDFTWDGKEFLGSAKLDSGRWFASVIHHGASIAPAQHLEEHSPLAEGMSASFKRSAPTPAWRGGVHVPSSPPEGPTLGWAGSGVRASRGPGSAASASA